MRFKVIHQLFPDYLIGEDGTVERRVDSRHYQKAGRIIRGRVLRSGYRQFNLVGMDGRKHLVRGNRLVCEAYHGPPPTAAHHAAHKDGDRLNDTPENLYWATPKENKADSIRHGTATRGERVANRKLTDEAVRIIRATYTGRKGELVSLAKRFGVVSTCIQKVVTRQTWTHVDEHPGRRALDRMQGRGE